MLLHGLSRSTTCTRDLLRVRADIIGHARINMYVNISHAWFKMADYFRTHRTGMPEEVRLIEQAIRHTSHSYHGNQYTIRKVYRIENMALWKQYWHRKQEMIETHHANNVQVRPLGPAAETNQKGAELYHLRQIQISRPSLQT